MNQLISFFSRIRVRQIIVSILVGVTFLFTGFAAENLQAQAKSMTPEAGSYQVNHSDRTNIKYQAKDADNDEVDNAAEPKKSVTENIVEKLNLKEPLPESTKKFFDQVQDKAEDVVNGTDSND